MEKFRFYFSVNCVSFTILILLFALLSIPNITGPLNATAVFALFAMTALIALVLFFTDKVQVKNQLMRSLIDIVLIIGIVFGIGIPAGVIPATLPYALLCIGMILVVYLGTFVILVVTNRVDAEKINKQIRNLRKDEH